ncbi:serine/threonine-protein kinase TAO3-like isoform X2 [Lytechinus variegatus]|uniref:serine/threonine-protein kinase TAO3-like isoform X2 n=1 Tax=Lytechinus variegatus TaxID=7654 RepID=UPI001BB11CFD|nr:serine/threonine-protein kinase TAO3-like isoform X2 [Lytechinus variegatus]
MMDSSCQLDDDCLARLANNIGEEEAETLGRKLGFKQPEINRYIATNLRSNQVTCAGTRQMLFDWRQKVSQSDQADLLRKCLLAAQLVALAEEFLGENTLLKEMPSDDVQRHSNEALAAGDDQIDGGLSLLPQPEVKLDSIKMEDLKLKHPDRTECDFHDKKAREHDNFHLGGGSFGNVFKAVHNVHGEVAVKLAKPGKEDHVKMYQKEAGKHATALTCRMIVTIKGIVQCEDDACQCGVMGFVLEYMEKGSLWTFRINEWKDDPQLWPLTNRMVYQISSGMHFLHSKNIIHRDLKLENVLVDKDLNVKIADLGLATDLQSSTGDKCWGTDSHKPPEAFRTDIPNSVKIVTPEYDVYSFGMTLYELLTGIHPYSDRGFDMMKILKVESKQSPCLDPVPENTPQDLISIMERSWSYEPKDRPNFKDITDKVAHLGTRPTHESLGHYLGKPQNITEQDKAPTRPQSKTSTKAQPVTDSESLRQGIRGLSLNDHPTTLPITEKVMQHHIDVQESVPTNNGPEASSTMDQPALQDASKPSSFGHLKSQVSGQQNEGNFRLSMESGQSMNFTGLVGVPTDTASGLSANQSLQSNMEHERESSPLNRAKHRHGSGKPVPAESSHGASEYAVGPMGGGPIHQEIQLKVNLTVPFRTSLAAKMDQVMKSLERSKQRHYWDSSSSLPSLFSLMGDITLHRLVLPATTDEDDFTLYLHVCSNDDLDMLHRKSKKLHEILYGFFVDANLQEACHPVKPTLKVDLLEEQYNRAKEFFQKREKDTKSKNSKHSDSESSTTQSNKTNPEDTLASNKPGPTFPQTSSSGAVQINTGKCMINMSSLPSNMVIGDQHITNNYYGGSEQTSRGKGGAAGYSKGRQPKNKKKEKLCESKEKVTELLLQDTADLVPVKHVKSIGRYLRLTDVDVGNIEYEHRLERSSEIVYQVLLEWKRQNGSQATKASLASALWKAKCYDAASTIR